ncbi:hypothetical protein PsorP6_014236 [Peronosclerospora sorghi]|uniref:Uncharacterized protein n=1 Tax=Peronosclerospora sorghi TaxID=230839 RepID=A0ACC0VIL5_9STRA|nr:hypothetical protein PsorP6_014236 [Peronosclerospora sorghi]
MRNDKTACVGCRWQKFIQQVKDFKAQLSYSISNLIKYDWSQTRLVSIERRKLREKIQRQKDEEIVCLHQEAIAESAMHAMISRLTLTLTRPRSCTSYQRSSRIARKKKIPSLTAKTNFSGSHM